VIIAATLAALAACPSVVDLAATDARVIVRPGDTLRLRLPVPSWEHYWGLEYDHAVLRRERLAEYAAAELVYEFRAIAVGRTEIRGRCARGGERPVGECRIVVLIK
jgi:hypothetical protein